MNSQELKALLDKLNDDTISIEELESLHLYLQEYNDKDLSDIYSKALLEDELVPVSQHRFDRLLSDERILKDRRSLHTKRYIPSLIKWSAAAACISMFLLWQFDILNYNKNPADKHQAQIVEQIIPGGNKAKILLENGKVLDLATLKNDTIVKLDGYSIVKGKDGSVSYSHETMALEQEVYNTIVTPIGGQYGLELADGTKVMVNASSTLKYPIAFIGTKRKVLLQGEAFFEVTKHKIDSKYIPFIVSTGPQEIEVLGTAFNVKSHTNKISTTLVEGSVRLHFKQNSDRAILKPNQQSVYSTDTKSLAIKTIDPFYATAWKNGAFAFDNAPIREVMAEIARWYNVTVILGDEVNNVSFSGTISKYEEFTKLLQTIELTGSVKFKVDGRRVTVMP